MRMARRLVLLAVLGLAAWAPAARAADQPQWGQAWSRNMVSAETGLPDSFEPPQIDPDTGQAVPGTGRNVRWAVPLGTETYSTPVVAQGKILIGTNNGRPRDPRHQGDRGVLVCLDEADGRFRWQLVVPKRSEDMYLDWPGVGICSPATIEGNRAYLVTNRGEVVCLDLGGQADGNDGPYRDEGRHMAPPDESPMDVGPTDADIVWLFDMMAGVGSRQHDAPHSSVLVDGPFVYAGTSNGVDNTHWAMRTPDAPSLVVLDKATGRLAAVDDAHTGPQIIHSQWSSASLGEVAGRRLVFFGGGDAVCWAFEALGAPPPGRPGRLRTVWRFDCDPDAPKRDILKWQDNRDEGPSNITGMPVFVDGRVYVTAGGDYYHGKPETWLKCIDATGSGDVTKGGQVWSQPLKHHCLSTPAVWKGLVFTTDCGRQISCLDAETGRPYWVHTTRGEMWSSPLVADGKVYVTTLNGEVVILAAARQVKVLATVRCKGPIRASPVAANGRLYLATRTHLLAIERMEK